MNKWTEKTGQMVTYDEFEKAFIFNPLQICTCISFNSDLLITGLPQNMNYVR